LKVKLFDSQSIIVLLERFVKQGNFFIPPKAKEGRFPHPADFRKRYTTVGGHLWKGRECSRPWFPMWQFSISANLMKNYAK